MKKLSSFRIAAIAGGLTVAALALSIHLFTTFKANAAEEVAAMNLHVDNSPPPREGIMKSFAAIVKKVTPSVVRIDTTEKIRAPRMQLPPGWEQFAPFFGHFGGNPQQYYERQGLGSGVIVTKDGYILTNNHVVDGADDIKVTLADNREFKAKVVGRDKKTDVAVLKVNAHDLPAITTADSDKIEVGDVVLAIGNPFNLSQTVTMGIVSATGRSGLGIETYEDFIQTDAAINPGNSGGALVDVEGRLIGINAAILSRSGGNQGIGFAVPINMARSAAESLIKNGRVIRGFLGIRMQPLTSDLAREFGTDQSRGVVVTQVVPDSPADKAGLKDEDIIMTVNGQKVADPSQLSALIAQEPPGSHVKLTVIRDGSEKTLDATLRARTAADDQQNGMSSGSQTTSDNLQGVTVSDLNQNARSQYNIPDDIKGVLVTDVDQDSAAYQQGLRVGDVILDINRHRVTNAAQAVRLTENQKDKRTFLRVWSQGYIHYMVVDEGGDNN